MKIFSKLFSTLVIIIFCFSLSEARKTVGLGFVLGSPSGLNGKFWLSHNNSLDITIGWRHEDFWMLATYLWHNWSAFGKSGNVSIPLYYGIGGFAGGREKGKDSGFGPHFTIGLDFIFENAPFDIFMEIGPAIQLVSETEVFFHGGIGARFFFP